MNNFSQMQFSVLLADIKRLRYEVTESEIDVEKRAFIEPLKNDLKNSIDVLIAKINDVLEKKIEEEKMPALLRSTEIQRNSGLSSFYDGFRNSYFYYLILSEFKVDDHSFSRLIEQIVNEIGYFSSKKLIVTSICSSNERPSENYFWAEPKLNIIGIPPRKHLSLLTLPDLYHELGHIIFVKFTQTEEYKNLFQQLNYIIKAKNFSRSIITPDSEVYENWLKEFCCDLIATYTVGPAYAWANLYIVGFDNIEYIYKPNKTHPTHEARKRIINMMLMKIKFHNQTKKINRAWSKIKPKKIKGLLKRQNNEYFTDDILLAVSNCVYQFCVNSELKAYSVVQKNTVAQRINIAWTMFNKQTTTGESYLKWEETQVKEMIEKLL
jgi:hypothetical protein